jgi:hypothetical protein
VSANQKKGYERCIDIGRDRTVEQTLIVSVAHPFFGKNTLHSVAAYSYISASLCVLPVDRTGAAGQKTAL